MFLEVLLSFLHGSAQGPYLKYHLAEAQSRLPGSESQGGALQPELLSLPRGSYTGAQVPQD